MDALSHLKYHYFYKITKTDTGQFYYGIHSTNNLNDGYMGSGIILRRMYKSIGKKKFIKEILKFFNSRHEASEYEKKIVTESLLKQDLCLNLALGGDLNDHEYGMTLGLVTVRDKDGNCFDVKTDDPRYLSGELVHSCKGLATVRDSEGKCFKIRIDDPDYIAGKYISVSKGNKALSGKTTIHKDGVYLVIETDELEKYKELGWEVRSKCRGRISPTKNMMHLIKDGKSIMVKRSDAQSYLDDGWENRRDVTPLKGTICLTKDGKNLYVDPNDIQSYLDNGWQRGGTSRNSGKLTCTLDNGKTYIQLDKDDPRVISGEAKTAFQLREPSCKGLKYIHLGTIVKRVKESEIESYIKNGYKIGIKDKYTQKKIPQNH